MAITPSEALEPTVARDPLIGALLGEYRVLSRLGEGGMGVVYRGEQQLLAKPVAIKVLKPGISGLLEEARAVTAAHHPNIIDIFSFGEAPSGQQYFVMECLEGESLDLYAQKRGGKLPLDEIATILLQVTAGLGAAHAAGVIHRDLKPGNIFYARLQDGTRFVKVLDFGLAKRADPNVGVRGTSIVGTPLYMAPEQASKGELGPWTDLYALGCIAYELIAGAPPFAAPSIIETLHRHVTHTPPRLVTLDPNVPPELDALVFELLEKLPARRPKSAAVVRRALDRAVRQLSMAGTRPTGLRAITQDGPVPQEGEKAAATTEVAARRVARPPLMMGLAVAALLAVGVGAWLLWKPLPPATVADAPIDVAPTDVPPSSQKPPPVAKPRPRPTGPSIADVEARIDRLERRADELEPPRARIARTQLEELRTDLKGKAGPDKTARELDAFERETFTDR